MFRTILCSSSKSGDWITVGDHEGIVHKTGLISTNITTFDDDASIVLPKSEIVSTAVLNRTLGLDRGRVDIAVGVAYGSDVSKVTDVLQDCAEQNRQVLENPEPTVILTEFSDSSLFFVLRAYIPGIRDVFDVTSDIRLAILGRFEEEGIKIPFPQRDIWIREGTRIDEKALPNADKEPSVAASQE